MSPCLRTALRWTIALGLVAVVLVQFDPASVGGRLAAVDPGLATVGIAGLVAVHLVGALTWRRLLDRLSGVRLDWPATIRLYYAAQAVGSITPANLGADVYRVAAVNAPAGLGSMALPIVVQRLTSICALLVLGGLGALVLLAGRASARASFGLLLVGVAAIVIARAPWRQLATWLEQRLPLHDGDVKPSTVWASVARDGLGLGLVFHGASLGFGLLLVAAIDPATAGRTVEVLAALAVARLSLAVPISPSGLGIQEGALAILFVQLGLEPDVALAAVLLNRVALVGAVLLGAIALLGGARASTSVRASVR